MVTPLDSLSDTELAALNRRFGWVCATTDARGRVFGAGKPFQMPERKILIAEDKLGLKGKTVVEFGALEGCHTVSLAQRAKSVIALEGQNENVEKIKVRTRMYGVSVDVRRMDLETDTPPGADLYFNSGVLYHLQDPAAHLTRISAGAKELLLDTHYVKDPPKTYTSANGGTYPCSLYHEHPGAARSGLRSFSRWLGLPAIVDILKSHYIKVEVVRDENERNGPRVTIVAKR